MANEYSGNVSAFSINSASGALAAVPGSPFATGGYVRSVAVDPGGKFAYAANDTTRNVSAYRHRRRDGSADGRPGLPVPRRTERPVGRGRSNRRVRLRGQLGLERRLGLYDQLDDRRADGGHGIALRGRVRAERGRGRSLGQVRPGGQLLVRRRLGLRHQRGFGSAVGAVRLALPDDRRGAPVRDRGRPDRAVAARGEVGPGRNGGPDGRARVVGRRGLERELLDDPEGRAARPGRGDNRQRRRSRPRGRSRRADWP
ncbi:MAG: hypothetical protein MZU84_09410 [Sphingobacterium sp.]|nr:hypothetical protein [Sphingobacterium sp.]